MTTGSLCLTLILMLPKPWSSNTDAPPTADSTSASGVALPYFSMNRLSSEPALTPIRIGMPAAPAALATSPTLPSNSLMLPGFTRTAAQPASIAAKMYFGWKWISAMTGIWLLVAIAASASASSWRGHATRTMSQPVAVSSAICCRVELTSWVLVGHIDCTDIGLSLPTPTSRTISWRVLRRGASVGAGAAGIPRPVVTVCLLSLSFSVSLRAPHARALLEQPNRVDHIGGHRQQHVTDHQNQHYVGRGHQFEVVHRRRSDFAAGRTNDVAQLLVQRDGDVPAVERQQRHQVDDAQNEVQLRQEQPERHPDAVVHGVSADDARSDDADRGVQGTLPAADRVDQGADLGWNRDQRFAQQHSQIAGEGEGGRHRGDRVVVGGPGRCADDPHHPDVRRLRALAVADPALPLGDVDVFGHRLAVALDHDRNGAVQLLHGDRHVGEVGHRGVTDLEHHITGPDPGGRRRPVTRALLEVALLDF